MVRATTALFIAEAPNAHGVYDAPVETTRELPITVRSVGMRETYEAMSVEHKPELVAILEHEFDYHDEKTIQIESVRYNVLRQYANQWHQLELVLERSANQYV